MPIYEYRCSVCDRVFEALQRVSDEPLDSCRSCGGPARRIISTPAIRFVGTGWYVTDYADKGQARKEGRGSAGNGAELRNGKESTGGDKGRTASSPATKNAPESRSGAAP